IQILVIIAAIFSGLLFGYEISNMNIILIMDAFRISFYLSTWDEKTPFYRDLTEKRFYPYNEGLMLSSFLFGGIFGSILSYKLEKKYGAKLIIYICSGIFILGSLLQICSFGSTSVFIIGRFISGLCIGCICVICPTYLVEVAPVKIRNFVTICYQISIGFGIIFTTLVCGNRQPKDPINNKYWVLVLLIQIILGIIFGITIYNLPTSPRWLCTNNRDIEAFYIIEKINGMSYTNDIIQAEIKAVQNAATDSYLSKYLKNCNLLGKVNRRQTFVTIIFQFFQQWSGINFFLYYQPKISISLGFTRITGIIIIPLINSIIYCISSIIRACNIHRVFRKFILVIGMILFIVYVICDHMVDMGYDQGKKARIIIALSIFIFVFIYSCSWGCVPNIYQSEIFHHSMRVKGTTLSITSHYLFSALNVLFSSYIIQNTSFQYLIVFCIICGVGFVFALIFCEESKEYELDEIE
ncbi:general substrate transporter, partial [Anaeromyces robustus]